MNQIRIATRASKLALVQANQIKKLLSLICKEVPTSIVEISTRGDRDKSDFLYTSGSVGFFTSEVERALLDGKADVAVHSLKDLPTTITNGLVISAIPQREMVSDVLVTAQTLSSLQELPKGATIGTSSLRRMAQLKRLRPDLDCRPLRGNVETRIRKVHENKIDAIVIARAGLNRLGLSDQISVVLPPDEFLPAPGQGALAVQTRCDDVELCDLVSKLEDPVAKITTETERRILAGLHGGCSIPLGIFSQIENETIHVHAILCNLAATKCIRKYLSGPVDRSMEIAETMTQQILEEGGQQILDEIHLKKEELIQ